MTKLRQQKKYRAIYGKEGAEYQKACQLVFFHQYLPDLKDSKSGKCTEIFPKSSIQTVEYSDGLSRIWEDLLSQDCYIRTRIGTSKLKGGQGRYEWEKHESPQWETIHQEITLNRGFDAPGGGFLLRFERPISVHCPGNGWDGDRGYAGGKSL